MRKIILKTAISTHLILDLQDVAWYMSQVHVKIPQVKSFFSQHDRFEYSQIAVKQDVQEEEEALVTGDYWHVNGLRRELIRHPKDKRQHLHEMNRSETTPIPKDQLLDERETHIEYQRARRRFSTRTTGAPRRRGLLTRWKNSGRARRSTRSRRTMRFLKMLSEVTLTVNPNLTEETQMICFTLSQPLLIDQVCSRSQALKRERQANRFRKDHA